MRFYIAYLLRNKVGIEQRLTYYLLLCQSVWSSNTIAATILIDSRATNERKNSITSLDSLREPLKHNDSTALTKNEAIGIGIKGFAVPIFREHAHLTEIYHAVRVQNGIHTTHQSEVTFIIVQTLASKVQSN